MQNVQKRIQRLLNELVDRGAEHGVQAAAYYQGELVVDAWAGDVDTDTKKPRAVDGDTLFPVFSTTKGLAATMAHQLVESGKIDYDTRIAEVWPEFAANGKSEATFRHALNHTVGIPQMPMGITYKTLGDWDAMCAAVAKLQPRWKPGTHMEYHAITYSWTIGEVLRRVDGRSFAEMLKEDVCDPLGIKDLYVGIPDKVESRVALLEMLTEMPAGTPPPPPPPEFQSIPTWLGPLHGWMNRPDARRACIPASNGIMSARAIARHYAALVPGGVDGVELLPPSRIRLATKRQFPSVDQKDAPPMCVGLGYHLGCKNSSMGSRVSAFGHGGYGGSLGFADPRHRLAVGVTKNYYSSKGASHQIACEIRAALGVPI